jgi:hypothetical protein
MYSGKVGVAHSRFVLYQLAKKNWLSALYQLEWKMEVPALCSIRFGFAENVDELQR